jgi:hypothetical protein
MLIFVICDQEMEYHLGITYVYTFLKCYLENSLREKRVIVILYRFEREHHIIA